LPAATGPDPTRGGEPIEDCDRRHHPEEADVEEGQSDELGHFAMLDRGHESAADVATHDVQAIDRQCERQEQDQQDDGLAAHFGSEQVCYGTDKPVKGREIERRGFCAHSGSWAGAIAVKLRANLC
jgi:hypothetical protein